jgi:hypothetical protein
VQVVDAAGVVQAEGVLEHGLDAREAVGGQHAGDEADGHHVAGVQGVVADGADGHAAGQGGVLDVHGSDLPRAVEVGGGDEGAHGGAGQGQHGVEAGALLGVRVGHQVAAVEGGPVDEQEQRAQHGEEVVGVADLLLGGLGGLAQHHGHGQTEVGAEHVDLDGASGVRRVDGGAVQEQALVEGVEDALEQGHDHQLQRVGLADDGTEGDQQRRHLLQAVVQGEDVHVHKQPVLVVPLQEKPL